MSKASKPTKKGTVAHGSKSTEKSTVSKDSKPTKKDAITNESKPAERGAVSNDIKPTEKTAVSNESGPTEKGAMSNNMKKPTEKAVAGETAFLDFTKLMSQFRLPGVDFAALVDRERENIEALAKANRIAFEGWQRLVLRQAEIFQETMKKVVAYAGQEAAKKREDLAKEGFEKALADMRELAEMATKSQKEAFDVVRKRIEVNVEGIRNFGKKLTSETAFWKIDRGMSQNETDFPEISNCVQGEQMRAYCVPKST